MSTGPIYVDWGKLAQIVIIIVATTVLGALKVIDGASVTGIIGLAAGYVFGNGKSVKGGHPQAPLLGLRPVDEARPERPLRAHPPA